MLFQILTIVIVVIPAFLWATKGKGFGFLSAFLALLCTIAAAAVAFGVWELVVYGLLLDRVPDLAWGLGLLLPFLLTLVALRIVVDQLVKANLDFDDVTNFVGGAVCGAAVGYIVAGMVVVSVSFFRLPGNAFSFQPIKQDGGSIVVDQRLWIRADEMVVRMFEHMSTGAFATGTPLARHLPAAHLQAATQRQMHTSDRDGRRTISRNTLPAGSARIAGHYVIDGASDVLRSDRGSERAQEVRYIDGSQPPANARLHGFVVQFDSRAQERSGQVLIGPGQVRLIARRGSTSVGFHPIAIIARPEARSDSLYRFRMDAPDIHLASVGGAASAEFGFEFILPQGMQPVAMFIKNTRIDLARPQDLREGTALPSVAARDDLVASGDLFSRFGGGGGSRIDLATLDRAGILTVGSEGRGRFPGIGESFSLPGGRIINSGVARGGGFTLNERNRIVEGSQKFRPADFRQRGLDRNLVVQDFLTSADTTIVQLTIVDEGNFSPIGDALVRRGNASESVYLVDADGRRFQAVGFYYEDGSVAELRFTPGRPLQSMRDFPEVSTAKRDQTLMLVFRPTRGVNIRFITVGNQAIAELSGGLQISASGN